MLIGIDARLWNQTGVGRYIRNLVTNLNVLDKKNSYVLFIRSEDEWQVKKGLGLNFKVVICNIKWHSLKEQIQFASFLNFYKLDLMHFPYFSVPFLYRKKFIVTVHDLIINKFNTGKASTLPYPLYLTKRFGYKFILSNALRNSQKIIVPSIAIKNDLVLNYKKIPQQKIEVTYEGAFEENNYINKKLIDGDYLLRVGNFYPHKNVKTLLRAFKNLNNKNLKLVLVGKKDFFYNQILFTVQNLNIENKVIFLENPNDENLFALYKNAKATIVPSFMEGFSLTAVEAMSIGSPLIVSDIKVHREICKTEAFYFNPEDELDLQTKIKKVLVLSQNQREALIENEIKRSKVFSWKKMTKETLKVYESSISLR